MRSPSRLRSRLDFTNRQVPVEGAAGNRSACFVAALRAAGPLRPYAAQLTHFGIHTTDLDRMVDFYTLVAGFVISDTGRRPLRRTRGVRDPEP